MRILDPKIEMQLMQIFCILDNLTKNSYLVGGCVRDYLTGKTPTDYDIVTDVSMDILEQEFAKSDWKVNATGKQFLVLSISKDGEQYEIANFRKDGSHSDGRRPDSVSIGTIEEDAARRDFTVNALYLKPREELTLKTDWTPAQRSYKMAIHRVLDPTGKGEKDLEKRILRFVGKPEDRIKEDYLRVFRFYRFLKKGFVADPKSMRAVRELFNEAYANTTPERVRAELEKMV